MPDTYSIARERYAALGVDAEQAITKLACTPVSLQCWQGDDCHSEHSEESRLKKSGEISTLRSK